MRIHLSDHFTYGKLLRFAAEALAFALTLCFFRPEPREIPLCVKPGRRAHSV